MARGIGRILSNPIDAVRRKLTSGLEVAASVGEVRRGGELQATVTITEPDKLGALAAGLVCTETYDHESYDSDGSNRHTTSKVAFEAWQPIECIAGTQTVDLRVPADAPFTYDGEILRYRWEVVARGDRKGKLDARAGHDIVVLP